ncbi:putative methyltransferase-domain-containing protein [Podospora didyma]|uniref:Methyltransferase-domain-containing protein n=1 Tax=Podospora didyma TaxID=330526 RepID=A0AAE0N3W6_9PEZI|nr:putative methyltransferase-domain-containing protein [Podospora didyma]
MTSLESARQNPQIARFCRQYLQLDSSLDYPQDELLREEATQEVLYERLFADDAIALPKPPRYKLRVLKELVARTEAAIVDWEEHEITDNLMETLSHLLSMPLPSEATAAQQRIYVTYSLSRLCEQSQTQPEPSITLLEAPSLISASGTTGFRTWEAALHLGQYLCAKPALIENKRILELGTGTGYLTVLCAKHLGARHVVASDGSDEVIHNLSDSLFLNGLQGSDKVTPTELKWGHALIGSEEDAWNGGRTVDVVLGADITYDARLVPALVATLQELVGLFPEAVVLIAATERNKANFEYLLQVCESCGFSVSHGAFPVPARSAQNGPFYDDKQPIHICQLRHVDSVGNKN